MKKIIFTLYILACFSSLQAQSKLVPLDKSPMDMAYYPANYPVQKISGKTVTEPLVARVIYGRPQKNGRTVFGGIVEYDKVWRLGANEATEVEFYKDVKISGKKVKKGRYTFYSIPKADKWTLILNKETDTWGSFAYSQSKDVLRTEVQVQKQTELTEAFTIQFEKASSGFEMWIVWDDVKLVLPISL